jgi:RNA polymerase sigma-70 factor (ECF subfamily)
MGPMSAGARRGMGPECSMDEAERRRRDRAIHRAVMAGDGEAWRTWYDESFEPLYAYALWRCRGTKELADEVVQETWLIAVRRIARFDPERGAFLDWLRGIAANVLRNHLRRADRQGRRHQPLEGEPANPEGQTGSEHDLAVAATLAELPERYESVLRAKYLDRQSVAQIAGALCQTEKSIESLLSRARQAFREVYQRLQASDE